MRTLGTGPSTSPPPHRSRGRGRLRSTAGRDAGGGSTLLDPSRLLGAASALAGGRSRQARRLVAAALAALAVLTLSAGLARPQGSTTEVVVMARGVAASTVISADDVVRAPWPSDLATTGLITDPAAVVGRRTAVPVDEGAPLTTNALMGPALLTRSGLVLAPIRVDDAGSADLVSAGDHVDVLAAPDTGSLVAGGTATVVATDAMVVATPARSAASSSSSFLGGGAGSTGSGTILLALDRGTAARVAAASASSRLSLVVRAR